MGYGFSMQLWRRQWKQTSSEVILRSSVKRKFSNVIYKPLRDKNRLSVFQQFSVMWYFFKFLKLLYKFLNYKLSANTDVACMILLTKVRLWKIIQNIIALIKHRDIKSMGLKLQEDCKKFFSKSSTFGYHSLRNYTLWYIKRIFFDNF